MERKCRFDLEPDTDPSRLRVSRSLWDSREAKGACLVGQGGGLQLLHGDPRSAGPEKGPPGRPPHAAGWALGGHTVPPPPGCGYRRAAPPSGPQLSPRSRFPVRLPSRARLSVP